MKILGIPNGINGAGYYRCFLPLTRLAKYGGHEVSLPPPGNAAKGIVQGTWIGSNELTVGHCIGKPGGAMMWESWRENTKLVFDVDDDIAGSDPRSHPEIHEAFSMPGEVEAVERVARASHLVTVSTPVLAERFSKFNPNVKLLPNCVNKRLLEVERPRRDRVTVGWQGSPSHKGDMQYHGPALKRFFRQNPDVDLHVMAGDYRKELGRPDARFTPWQIDMWAYYRSVDFDIGIAPLAPNPFNDAKSHIKALEYAALGIPVVASDCPAYRDFVVHGETGFLVRYDHEWGKRLRELACDADMRAEMGARAKERARGFVIDDRWPEWEAVYKELV